MAGAICRACVPIACRAEPTNAIPPLRETRHHGRKNTAAASVKRKDGIRYADSTLRIAPNGLSGCYLVLCCHEQRSRLYAERRT